MNLIKSALQHYRNKSYARHQQKFHKNHALTAHSLRDLAIDYPGFAFEMKNNLTPRQDIGGSVFTTNIPCASGQPANFAQIYVDHTGIRPIGFPAMSGKDILSGVETGVAANFAKHDPLIAAQKEFMPWLNDVAAPVKPAQAATYETAQANMAATDKATRSLFELLAARNTGFQHSIKTIFDEHHGVDRVVVTTNIPARGRNAEAGDYVTLIATPDAVRLSGMGPSVAYNALKPAIALGLVRKLADLSFPYKASTKPTGEALNRVPTLTA